MGICSISLESGKIYNSLCFIANCFMLTTSHAAACLNELSEFCVLVCEHYCELNSDQVQVHERKKPVNGIAYNYYGAQRH